MHRGPLMGRAEENKGAKTMNWVSEPGFQGWICSRCEWNCPLPTLLTDPQAKSAFDRLAAGKFREHECQSFLARLAPADPNSFTARIRKLVGKGFKPKDAVEILMEEVMLENSSDSKIVEEARIAGEDFLRRVREGLV